MIFIETLNLRIMKKLSTLILLLTISSLSFGQLVLNEVLYDPPADDNDPSMGDANNDGVRQAQGDEFLEIINTACSTINISGYLIYDTEALDADEPRHIVPDGTILQPGQPYVIFGGGDPMGDFGGAIVQTASSGTINMNNSGDIVTITDGSGNVVLEFDIEPLSNNPDESYTRNPDLTGDFAQHDQDIPEANGALYSPGTMLTGMSFPLSVLVESIIVEGEGGASTIDEMGGTLQMTATVMPEDATNSEVTWSLDPETGVANIDDNGLLIAEDDGTVTVTATNACSGVSGSVEITISNQSIVLVESIAVEGEGGATSIEVPNGTLQMIATVLPENATDASVTWSIEPVSGIASIDANGLLTAEENGTVTVTATANDGSGVSGSAEIEIINQDLSILENDLTTFEVYPNPVQNEFIIKSDQRVTEASIYNLTGQLVRLLAAGTRTIDVSDLNEGVYIISIKTENGVGTSRFVKTK